MMILHLNKTKPQDIISALLRDDSQAVAHYLSGFDPQGRPWTGYNFEEFFRTIVTPEHQKECFDTIWKSSAWQTLPPSQKKLINWDAIIKDATSYSAFWFVTQFLTIPKDDRPNLDESTYCFCFLYAAQYSQYTSLLELVTENANTQSLTFKNTQKMALERCCGTNSTEKVLFLLNQNTRTVFESDQYLGRALFFSNTPEDIIKKYTSLYDAGDMRDVHAFFNLQAVCFLNMAMPFFSEDKKDEALKMYFACNFTPIELNGNISHLTAWAERRVLQKHTDPHFTNKPSVQRRVL